MAEKIWNHNKIAFGGDYNPEQWSEDVWEEDMRLFKLAHIDTVTLNVFSWASLQPDEETYNFEKLDKIMVRENGKTTISVDEARILIATLINNRKYLPYFTKRSYDHKLFLT